MKQFTRLSSSKIIAVIEENLRIKKVLLPLLTLVTFLPLNAQTGGVEGTIFMGDSSITLPGAHIYLEKTKFGATSNGSGYFSISNVPPGEYSLHFSSVGFITKAQNITIAAGETQTVNVNLIEAVSMLGDVVVMVKGNRGLKDIPGSVQYISPKEIQKFSYTDINRTLRGVR